MIKNILDQLILTGKFAQATEMVKHISLPEMYNAIFNIAYEHENICAYSFICFLLIKNESTELHCQASSILQIAFPHLNGAYASALWHTRRALELSPNNTEIEESLLFFYFLPLKEKLINNEEALSLAKIILTKKSNSVVAQDIINTIIGPK